MRTQLTCQICRVLFYPKSGRLSQKTCSKACGHKLRNLNGSPKKGKVYPHLQRARVGYCLICGGEYRATGDFKDRRQKYCSPKCYQNAWKEQIRPNMKRSPGLLGEDNYAWLGEEASYGAKHKWIARQLGTPFVCEHCGTTTAKKYEWANKDHQYRRDINDWMRLCTSCHRKYDYHMKLVNDGDETGWEENTPAIVEAHAEKAA